MAGTAAEAGLSLQCLVVTGRQKAIGVFVTLSVVLIAATITLNVGWIMIHWRRVVPLVLGIVTFGVIIAGLIVYTVFLVREIRRSEQHDSFINAVTHELKTPIASIRLYLETLQSRHLSEEQRSRFYQVMLADTDRLQYTVEQVLRAGVSGQKHRKEGAWVSVDMTSLVQEAVELARTRHHLNEQQVRYEMPTAGTSAHVLGDPEELLTALLNLLDNAVKYSPDHKDISVELLNYDPDRVLVRVTDRGMGIPPKQIKLIFNRFYRVSRRASLQVKGTGLGLYIVRSIARKHGGKVEAESAGEGKGSAFTLELPREA